MSQPLLKIATRESPLALWQAEHVAKELSKAHQDLEVVLVPMTTKGDQILDQSLSKIGGKGLFIKELEVALLEQRADIAVHSMKDVPAVLPPGFALAAMLHRANPYDALVAKNDQDFAALPTGAKVGTSSLRRQAQLLAKRPDLNIQPIRGNVQTRLGKLEQDFDAIILAMAGLHRLGLGDVVTQELDPEICLPAIGQGVVGIECREDDEQTHEIVQALHHPSSAQCVIAERSMGLTLGGDCQSPIAGFATLNAESDWLTLRGLVASPDGKRVVQGTLEGKIHQAQQIGADLGHFLLLQGAGELLQHD
ncbi:MAG: hydroxymethylbilane synthase [Pseudomonadota bacterium]